MSIYVKTKSLCRNHAASDEVPYQTSRCCVTICISKPIWGLLFFGSLLCCHLVFLFWFGFLVVDCLCTSSCSSSSSRSHSVLVLVCDIQFNAWHSVSCLFYFSPFLGMRIALSFYLSLALPLSVSSILWGSVSQPTTYNEIFRRMVTKSNCFI